MVATRPPGVHAFVARLVRIGSYYGVDVPAAVSRAIGVRSFVPVAVTVNRVAHVRATMIPRGGGRHCLWLNGDTRKTAGVRPGDRVAIALRVDREPRVYATPDDVAEALREEGVLETFRSLPAGRQGHILRWIDAAVHDETRARRIARTVEVALAEHEKRVDRTATNGASPRDRGLSRRRPQGHSPSGGYS